MLVVVIELVYYWLLCGWMLSLLQELVSFLPSGAADWNFKSRLLRTTRLLGRPSIPPPKWEKTVLAGILIAVMKHHNQKHVGEEGIYLASTSLFITEASLVRNSNRADRSLEAGADEEVISKCCLLYLWLACSAYFLIESSTTTQGIS